MNRLAPVLLSLLLTPAGVSDTATPLLGEPPLCEPSAALRAPWDPSTILVGDNEIDDSLFAFELVDGRLARERRLPLPAGFRPHDVEALAAAGDDLLVIGSHDRDRRCGEKPNRQRILVARWSARTLRLVTVRTIDTAPWWRASTAGVEACLRTLFADPRSDLASDVCGAIVEAESVAREGALPCRTFNIEGAFAVQAPGAEPRIWIGLRSPQVRGDAVLLRMTPGLDALRFDAVALADLGGRGIRELAVRGATLWGIAGPSGDGSDPFGLFQVPVAALEAGARLEPGPAGSRLPAASEGLVLGDGFAVAVIDGDRGDGRGAACAEPGRQTRVVLP